MLSDAIAELVRKEGILFHYLFSKNKQETNERDRVESLNLNVKISNVMTDLPIQRMVNCLVIKKR